jgi:hypothetical protein
MLPPSTLFTVDSLPLALTINIGLGKKSLLRENTLAYYDEDEEDSYVTLRPAVTDFHFRDSFLR